MTCFEQMRPDSTDIVTVVHIVIEVQMFVKRPSQEMKSDAFEMNIAIAVVDSIVVIGLELAAEKRRKVMTEFLQAHDNLLDLPALDEATENSLCRSSAAGTV